MLPSTATPGMQMPESWLYGPANFALGCGVHLHLHVVWEVRVLPVQPCPGQVHANFGTPCRCQLGQPLERVQALAVSVPAKSDLLAFLLCTTGTYQLYARSPQCRRGTLTISLHLACALM